MFIRRAYEDRVVTVSTLIRDAVLNAVGNNFRKKGASFRKLWQTVAEVDKKDADNTLKAILNIEKKEKDNDWRKVIRGIGRRASGK